MNDTNKTKAADRTVTGPYLDAATILDNVGYIGDPAVAIAAAQVYAILALVDTLRELDV